MRHIPETNLKKKDNNPEMISGSVLACKFSEAWLAAIARCF
jgi:hypothetical protein